MQSIIPCFRCNNVAAAIAFYTQVLDFELAWAPDPPTDPAFCALVRQGAELHLSSHAGDGVVGNKAYVVVPAIDSLFQTYLARGLDTSAHPDSPIHQGPTDQTWGTREFCVQDPSGNSLCFGQRNW